MCGEGENGVSVYVKNGVSVYVSRNYYGNLCNDNEFIVIE